MDLSHFRSMVILVMFISLKEVIKKIDVSLDVVFQCLVSLSDLSANGLAKVSWRKKFQCEISTTIKSRKPKPITLLQE